MACTEQKMHLFSEAWPIFHEALSAFLSVQFKFSVGQNRHGSSQRISKREYEHPKALPSLDKLVLLKSPPKVAVRISVELAACEYGKRWVCSRRGIFDSAAC